MKVKVIGLISGQRGQEGGYPTLRFFINPPLSSFFRVGDNFYSCKTVLSYKVKNLVTILSDGGS